MLPVGLPPRLDPTESAGQRTGPAPQTLKELGTGHQTFPDTCRFDYASYLRDDSGSDLGPLVVDVKQVQSPTVALIGGGIANVIAAYELSRCAVKVTVFERDTQLGGRMTTIQTASDMPPFEMGANRFPAESRLIWHYVRMWAKFRCRGRRRIRIGSWPDPSRACGALPPRSATRTCGSTAPVTRL
jgi:hypothetical protein